MGILSSGLKSSLSRYSVTNTDPTQRSIDNAQSRLSFVGEDEPKTKDNFLVTILKNIGRTGYGATNALREMLDPDTGLTPNKFDPLQAFWRGLTLEEMPTGKDVMTGLGFSDRAGFGGGEAKWYNPSPAGVVGLGMDMVNPLDPLNWITLGVGNAAKKGGIEGIEALTKTFGSQATKIASTLGDDVVKTLSAPSAGKLLGQIGKEATKKGVTGDTLTDLLTSMREGMKETGVKATTKLPSWTEKPITVGFQNPLSFGTGKTFGEVAIPGSEKLYGLASRAKGAVTNNRVADAFGKLFSTKHVPMSVPDSVILRDITGQQIDDLVRSSDDLSKNLPLSREELLALKNELGNIQPLGTTYKVRKPETSDFTSFTAIANRAGLDPQLARSFFETELPFTMTIPELYQKIANVAGNTATAKAAFEQAARLRKVMDMMADNIPDELIPFFKGTVVTPPAVEAFRGSSLNKIPAGTIDSPLINFVFDYKGINITVVANSNRSFNQNVWENLGKAIATLDEIPEKNLQVLKDRLQLSPVPLGKNSMGFDVGGYATPDGATIVLSSNLGDPIGIIHEYGHVLQSNLPVEVRRGYADIVKGEGGPITPYAQGQALDETKAAEDLADAFASYRRSPDDFRKQYPQRANYIDQMLQQTQISPEELEKLVTAQKDRAATIANMPAADAQIDDLLKKIDQASAKKLNKLKFQEGTEAYQQFRSQLTEIFEQTGQKVEDFVRQVETIFKDVPLAERKKIMETAAGGYINPGPKTPVKTSPDKGVQMYAPEYAPTWYTKTEKNVLPKMGKSIPTQDFRNLLKSQGVKEDEIKWLGLEDLLKGKDKVTKVEVEDWLKWNNLEIQEVYKGSGPVRQGLLSREEFMSRVQEEFPNLDQLAHSMGVDRNTLENATQRYYDGVFDDEDGVEAFYSVVNNPDPQVAQSYTAKLDAIMAPSQVTPTAASPKYSQYVVPGGEDYQELLFTLPGESEEQLLARMPKDLGPVELDRWLSQQEKVNNKFQSQHWSEPNVVAHTRFDTRYTPDGEKVLFIEEIQSDWHQAGREHGYKESDSKIQAELKEIGDKLSPLKREYEKAQAEWEAHRSQFWETTGPNSRRYINGSENRETRQVSKALRERMKLLQEQITPMEARAQELFTQLDPRNRQFRNAAVEHAPFEKSWPELIMKRMVRYAAENGYDRIAWTTGIQQAERYSLSKSVDKLIYHPEDSVLSAYKGGERILSENVPKEQLGDYVGKEAAVHLLQKTPDETGQLILEGADLDVGGEGMRGFYDRMIPLQFDKYAKKFGGGVEPVELAKDSVDGSYSLVDLVDEARGNVMSSQLSIPVTQKMRDEVLYNGQPLFTKANPTSSGLSEKGEAALSAFLKWRDTVVKTYKQLEIPVNELENYVPFIPMRKLKPDEQQAMRTVFGTGIKTEGSDLDSMVAMLSKTDPNLKPRTTQAKSPAEVNAFLGKEWLTEDAALAMALRGTRAIKGQEVAKFLTGFVEKYGLKPEDLVQVTQNAIPDGYKMYIIKTEGNGKKLLQEVYNPAGLAQKDIEGFFIPEDMANIYNEYADLIFGNTAKNPLLQVYDMATAAYKKVAYLWNPGHIARDFAGNVFNGYLMGVVNPLEYVDAAKYLMKPDTVIKLPQGDFTAKELLEKAQKLGLLDVGAAMAETPRDVIDRLNLPGRNAIANKVSAYSTLMREGTKKADLLTRFTGLIHELRAGKDFTQAAAQIKKFYFDYFDLTPFERKVMKRIIPFYTWMRKNIPLQVEQFIKNPRNYARVVDVMNAASGGPIDWDSQPEYIREGGAFRLGGPGNSYIAPNLPYQDLARVPTNLDALLQLLAGVNPLIRAPIEMATNTQWFSGQPVEDYPGQTREIPFAGVLKSLGAQEVPRIDNRLTGYALDQIPVLRNLDIMTNPENPRQASRISSFIGGPSVYTEEAVNRSQQNEELSKLQNLIRKLKDEGEQVPTTRELRKSGSRSRIRELLR